MRLQSISLWLQALEALFAPCIAPVSSIVPFVSPLFSARSAASFLPINRFCGCLCLSCFSAPSSESTIFPRSACARSSSILAKVHARCSCVPSSCYKSFGIFDLRVVSVKTPVKFPAAPPHLRTRVRPRVIQLRSAPFRGCKPLLCLKLPLFWGSEGDWDVGVPAGASPPACGGAQERYE